MRTWNNRVGVDRWQLSAALLSLLYLAYGLFIFNRVSRLGHDEGFVAFLAHLINLGFVPYRDFFLTITPGTFFVQALMQRWFGYQLIVSHWYLLAEHLLLFGLVWYATVRTVAAGAARLVPLALLFFGPVFAHPYYSLDALVLANLVLGLVLRDVDSARRHNLYAAALVAGLVVLFKQNIGAATTAFVMAAAFSHRRWFTLFGVAATAAVPFTLFCLYMVTVDAFWPYVQNTIVAPVSLKGPSIPQYWLAFALPNRFGLILLLAIVGSVLIVRMKSPVWRTTIIVAMLAGLALVLQHALKRPSGFEWIGIWSSAGVTDLIMKLPIAACVTAALVLWRLPSAKRSPSFKVLVGFAVLHVAAATAANATWYNLTVTFPFVYVLIGSLSGATHPWQSTPTQRPDMFAESEKAKPRVTGIAAVTACAALAVFGLSVNIKLAAFGEFLDSQREGNPIEMLSVMREPDVPSLKGMKIAASEAAILAQIQTFIQSRTNPSEEIFAYPMGIPIYVATDRISSSYYSHFFVEGAAPPDWNERTIDYLKSRRPKYVIIADIPAFLQGDDRDRVLSLNGRTSLLWNYIKVHFLEVVHFGRFQVLENRGLASS